MSETIENFLREDEIRVESLIKKYPTTIPTEEAAKLLGMTVETLRACIDEDKLGVSWRKDGKLNRGYRIPTAPFVRWYLRCVLK